MGTLRAFVRRRPVLVYYGLTFAISWGGILLAVGGPGHIPGTPDDFGKLMPLLLPAMLGGPSVAGILMTAVVCGKAGFREWRSRFYKFRLGSCEALTLLLLPPLLMAAIPLVISIFRPEYMPRILVSDDTAGVLRLAIAAGLGAGIFEEIGWTGFAIPRLRERLSVLSTGLVVGFLWGAWHLLVNVWSSGNAAGKLSWPLFLHSFLFSAGILPAFRVLMVWAYDRNGSLLLAMLSHFSLTAGNVLFVPQAVEGATGIVWSLSIAAALWGVVVAVVVAERERL